MKKRNIILTESQIEMFRNSIFESAFQQNPDIVLNIKKFLDKAILKQYNTNDVDENGNPKTSLQFFVTNASREPIREISAREILLMLDDNEIFHRYIKNDNDRIDFFTNIIRHWTDNKISKEGLLIN